MREDTKQNLIWACCIAFVSLSVGTACVIGWIMTTNSTNKSTVEITQINHSK